MTEQNNELRIIFAGTPDFSVPSLQALLESAYEVVAVYTQPDRPAGRGRKLGISPIKQLALEHALPVYQPVNFKAGEDVRQLAELEADIMVVAAYGLLLPESVLKAPGKGCINIHASILPRWRGAAPIQRAVLAGDAESGVSIMQMEKGLDTGPVYLLRYVPLTVAETGGSLHDKLSILGAHALMEALPRILDGSLPAQAQDNDLFTYAHKLDKREAAIDWMETAQMIERQVRAFNPWPVAYTRYKDANLRIWDARAMDEATASAGTVVTAGREGIDVATGSGLLRITRLQIPGKKAMCAADFVNAQQIQGTILG